DRTEAQAPPGRKVPRTFAQQLRAISHGVPLKPVARIRTRRLERPLRDSDGIVLALLADDEVASAAPGYPATVQPWRELEIEPVDGSPETLAGVARRCARPVRRRPGRPPSWPARSPTATPPCAG